MSHGTLPYTGAAVLTIGGVALDTTVTFIIAGVVLIGAGAALVRTKFRPGKAVNHL